MAAENFRPALALVLRLEGGYVNDRRDPGGATNKGITQAVYDAWRLSQRRVRQGVRAIADEEVEAIYHAQYWQVVQADALPRGLDYAVFDEAVHSGPVKAARDLQACLGVAADGHVGVITLQAGAKAASAAQLIERLCARRLSFLSRLTTWGAFGRGWTSRIAAVRKQALAMARA